MKTEFVRFLFPFSALLLGGALETALPQFASVGFPVLMASAILLGAARPPAEAVLLALTAGLLEDALGALPLATTASFLVPACLGARLAPAAAPVAITAYPVYQLWLAVWTTLPAGALWGRLVLSVPVAAATVLALRPLLLAWERRAAADAR